MVQLCRDMVTALTSIIVVESEQQKTVTPRDYTIIELRREARQRSRRMFWLGMLVGIALCILIAYVMGVRVGT